MHAFYLKKLFTYPSETEARIAAILVGLNPDEHVFPLGLLSFC